MELDSLVDFASQLSYSTVYVEEGNAERNDGNLFPLPGRHGTTSNQTYVTVGVKQKTFDKTTVAHWPSTQQEKAFADIYQKSLLDVQPYVRENRCFQQLRNDYMPQELDHVCDPACSAPECRVVLHEPSTDRHTRVNYQDRPPSGRRVPLENAIPVNAEVLYAYQQPYYYPSAEEERYFAISLGGVYGYSCADPRCDCRSYNMQTLYANGDPGSVQVRDAWETYPASLGGELEGLRERQPGWRMDMEQMGMEQTGIVQVQPY